MTDVLLFTLPEIPTPGEAEAHWWRIADGQMLASGEAAEWVGLTLDVETVVALAPAASVALHFEEPVGSSPRQAAVVAKVTAVSESLGDDETLHAVSAEYPDGSIATAVVENGVMLQWLDWAEALGVRPQHVLPVLALLPLGDGWRAASFGNQHIVGRTGAVFPNDPALVAMIVGAEDVPGLTPEEIHAALVRAAGTAPLDLRTGRFARRRGFVFDRRRLRELALLAATIPLIILLWAIVSAAKLEASTRALDQDTLSVAAAALGHPTTLAAAESELSQRAGNAGGGVMVPLTAVLSAVEPEQSVSATSLAYTSDGTFSVTLAGPNIDALNRVLLGLQRDGYRVTAVPRQSSDGRSMVDMTVRSGP